MALKATIYKADLNIANMDVHQYGDYQLTLALHPSETIERLMVRLLAFARFADEALEFTKDLGEKYKVDSSQIPIMWAIKKGVLPIVGLTSPKYAEYLAESVAKELSS